MGTREKFIRSLSELPTSSPTLAADFLRSTLGATDDAPNEFYYAILTVKQELDIVWIRLAKPFWGSKDPNPDSFSVRYSEGGRNLSRSYLNEVLGSPVLATNDDDAYWILTKGVLRFSSVFKNLEFTPFEKRALFDQVRIASSIALYPPQQAAKLAGEAVAFVGRPTDKPDYSRLLALAHYKGSPGNACIRRIDQDKFAVCAGVVDSDFPRHVWLDYIGPPELAVTPGIELLASYGKIIGIALEQDTFDGVLGSAIVDAPAIQRRDLEGNIVVQAEAYMAGQYLIIRLDACDRMEHVERTLRSGHPCFWR